MPRSHISILIQRAKNEGVTNVSGFRQLCEASQSTSSSKGSPRTFSLFALGKESGARSRDLSGATDNHGSERQPRTQLNLSSRRRHLGDRSKPCSVHKSIRSSKIRMIQRVEELSPRLKLPHFS